MSPRLEVVTPENVRVAVDLTLEPGQEEFVAPVAISLAEAYAQPDRAWPRLVYDEDTLVGFVMAEFDQDNPIDYFRCGIWRLAIAAGHQRGGYGRFAVEQVVEEAKRRGERRLSVLWVPGRAGPEKFYRRLGFTPTGQVHDGELVAERLIG